MGKKSVNPAESLVAKENKKAYNRPVNLLEQITKTHHITDGEREVFKCIAQEK